MVSNVPPAYIVHWGEQLARPAVWVVFVNTGLDWSTLAGIRSIVEDGYLDLAPGVGRGRLVGVGGVTVPTARFGYLDYVEDAALRPFVQPRPVDITLFVLPDDLPVEQLGASCNGCLVTGSYHSALADGRRYGVVGGRVRATLTAMGYPESQPLALYDAAHELVEAAAGAELADPCGQQLAPYGPYTLPGYSVAGRCTIPVYAPQFEGG